MLFRSRINAAVVAAGVVVVDHEAAQAVGGEEHLPLEAPHCGLVLPPAGDLLPVVGVAEPEAVPPLVPVVVLELQAVPAERQAHLVRWRSLDAIVLLLGEIEVEERHRGSLLGGAVAAYVVGRKGRVGVRVREEGREGHQKAGNVTTGMDEGETWSSSEQSPTKG